MLHSRVLRSITSDVTVLNTQIKLLGSLLATGLHTCGHWLKTRWGVMTRWSPGPSQRISCKRAMSTQCHTQSMRPFSPTENNDWTPRNELHNLQRSISASGLHGCSFMTSYLRCSGKALKPIPPYPDERCFKWYLACLASCQSSRAQLAEPAASCFLSCRRRQSLRR